MTCLDDRRLVDLHFGGGTGAERAHARDCEGCAARARGLARDLARIDAVVRTTAPRRRAARPATVWRWAPAAVAAVLALAVVLGRGTAPSTVEADDDVLSLAGELTDALTSDVTFDDDAGVERASARSTCAWGDPLLGMGCEQSAVLQIAWR